MTSSQRRNDLLLILLALLLLVISPIEDALGNDLPELLPAPVTERALPLFGILLSIIVVVDLIPLILRRRLSDDRILARNRRLRGWNVGLTVALAIFSAVAGILSQVAITQVSALASLTQVQQRGAALLLLAAR